MKIEVGELNPCAVLLSKEQERLDRLREWWNVLVCTKYSEKYHKEFPLTDYVHVDVPLEVYIKKLRPESLEVKLKNHFVICRHPENLSYTTYYIHKEDEQTFNALLKEK